MQKSNLVRLGIFLILAVIMTATGCSACKYSGGTGLRNDPYKIATAGDILALSANTADYGANFILTADIDLNPNLPERKIFTSSVISGRGFTGVLDGNGHKISNLIIDTNENKKDFLGLIEIIDGGEVKNLGMENVCILGGANSDYHGGIAGFNNKGCVCDCFTTGIIIGGNNSDSIGGIVGDNYFGSIIDSFSICDVAGGVSSSNLGGLAGGNIGDISECYSTGAITGGNISMWLGGLAGSNNGDIRNCYSSSVVASGEHSYNIGGLVGDNPNGTMVNCYSIIDPKIIALDM